MIRAIAIACALALTSVSASAQEAGDTTIIDMPDLSAFQPGDPERLLNDDMRARLDAMVGLGTRLLLETLDVASEPVAIGDVLATIQFEYLVTGVLAEDYRSDTMLGRIRIPAGTPMYRVIFQPVEPQRWGMPLQAVWCATSYRAPATELGERGLCIFSGAEGRVTIVPASSRQSPWAIRRLALDNRQFGHEPVISTESPPEAPPLYITFRLSGIDSNYVGLEVWYGDGTRDYLGRSYAGRRDEPLEFNILDGVFSVEIVDETHARVSVVKPPQQREPFQYYTGHGADGPEVYFANYRFLIGESRTVLQRLGPVRDAEN